MPYTSKSPSASACTVPTSLEPSPQTMVAMKSAVVASGLASLKEASSTGPVEPKGSPAVPLTLGPLTTDSKASATVAGPLALRLPEGLRLTLTPRS